MSLGGAGYQMAEQLDVGQVAMCAQCEEFCLDRSDLWDIEDHPTCDNCGSAGFKPAYIGHEAKKRSLENRWDPEVLAHGYTSMPDLLADSLPALGIDATHYLLLVILESYRRKDRRPVFPGVDKLAARTGWSQRTVERKLQDLRELRLIECERARRYGRQAENRITRNGLDAALRRLAKKRARNAKQPDIGDVSSPSLVTKQPVIGDVSSPS